MKFDIARKVVKFRNGQFGIRRWSLYGYQYLDLNLGRRVHDFWWGSVKEYVAQYAAGSESDVRARLAVYLAPKPDVSAIPGYDKGTPV